MDKKENDMPVKILIDYPHVATGLYLIRKNAQKTFQDAKFLYDNQKFQRAIPLFITSLEEALKAHELSMKLKNKQSISYQEWSDLQTHKHKLNYVSNFVIKNMESMDEKTMEEITKELGEEKLYTRRNEILALNKAEKGIQSHFQKLKEFCLYQNWNKEFKEWDEFDKLNSEQRGDLAYFVMKRAEIHLCQLDLSIEMAVYVIRRDNFMIHDLEFSTYNELRNPKDFETLNKMDDILDDYFKYHRGLRVLQSLMIKKAFAVIDQIVTNNLLKKCLKLPPRNDLENWYPHPVVKSIFNAMSACKREGRMQIMLEFLVMLI